VPVPILGPDVIDVRQEHILRREAERAQQAQAEPLAESENEAAPTA
jgi:hypothetical protein